MNSVTFPSRTSFVLVLAGILVAGSGSIAVAQVPKEEAPPPSATPVPPAAAPLEDKKLDQYADAYLDIEQIQVEASAQLDKADNEAAAVAIKEKAEGAIIQAIERSGLKLDEFNQITEVAELDNDVRRKIADRVEKRRTI
ncbi:DUF4168 domain-containing protein [Steroidobacter agaridevorans]|uniref:DUF4168 domain-containing protein n=1 Tax=Steroidobacter agaridevorans TaxID=2695856 RepID=UPI0013296573|nr:DUF4168 domain-containing protein [Steroidobacter agaridevorans]GFE91779.1 hypothetical protein GCM10011488_67330 [Steroidobacter agaridevorans]